MKNRIITITDNGNVIIPSETKMNISEIADLFGIYYQTAKKHIRAVEKSNIAGGDYSMGCVVNRNHIYAEYYGLGMVITVAFRVQSEKAGMFRKWVTRRITAVNLSQTILLSMQNSTLN